MTPEADKLVDEWLADRRAKLWTVLPRYWDRVRFDADDFADLKRRIAEAMDRMESALFDIREVMSGESKTSMLGAIMAIQNLVKFGLSELPPEAYLEFNKSRVIPPPPTESE